VGSISETESSKCLKEQSPMRLCPTLDVCDLRFWCGVLMMAATVVAADAGPTKSDAASRPAAAAIAAPGCEALEPKACLERALEAMGGRDRLAAVHTIQLDILSHTELMEQSYRQTPFITSYERAQVTRDFVGQRAIAKVHAVWPESDLAQADSDVTMVAAPDACVNRQGGQDGPCSASQMDQVRQELALGPVRLLLTASDAPDLHYEAAETLRSTEHTVLAFTWQHVHVRVALNRFNHLPDAVETKQQFRDFWYYWGDVDQRIYFDNWRWVNGLEYPSNEVTERNGAMWRSSQAVNITFNPPVDEKDFAMDAKIAQISARQTGWGGFSFRGEGQTLAPDIVFFPGAWNTTLIKQADGVVILETPISARFCEGIFAEAKKRFPGVPIKAVLSTSDSWPHVGGVRYDVAQGVPIYILDLNKPLLERMVRAPHTLDPDALAGSSRQPRWNLVTGPTQLGTGANRMLLIPLRGASTERQYMVYFPEHRLLYASDTLVLNDDKTIYDPELTREVEQAVQRDHLDVETVFAMHQAPVAWKDVVATLHKPAPNNGIS
jgi:hypothetical protein